MNGMNKGGQMRISVAEKRWKRFREKVKTLFRPGRGQNLERFTRLA